jgi:hypothetical protein
MNALHSHPATGGSVHALHKATLPLTSYRRHVNLFSGRNDNPQRPHISSDSGTSDASDEGEDIFLEPFTPYGVIFLRNIRLPGDPGGRVSCPRMDACFDGSVVAPLPEKAYKGVLGLSKEAIMQRYGCLIQSSTSTRRLPHPQGEIPFPSTPPPDAICASVTLPAHVTTNFAPDFDEGDDLEPEEQMGPAVQEIVLEDFVTDVNKVLDAFCSQVLQAIPPPKANNPYNIAFYHQCRDPHSAFTPTISNFNNLDLWLSGFTRLQTRDPHRDDWEDRWEYLFPSKFRIVRQNQFGWPQKADSGQEWNYQGLVGYKNCTYLSAWMNIMARSSADGATAIRAHVKCQFFDQLVWCP